MKTRSQGGYLGKIQQIKQVHHLLDKVNQISRQVVLARALAHPLYSGTKM
jgi:hypothetical protein